MLLPNLTSALPLTPLPVVVTVSKFSTQKLLGYSNS